MYVNIEEYTIIHVYIYKYTCVHVKYTIEYYLHFSGNCTYIYIYVYKNQVI